MTISEARQIFLKMRSINPLVDELHRRFGLGAPELGLKNLGNDTTGRNRAEDQVLKTVVRNVWGNDGF